MEEKNNIVIVGGGFGGLRVALNLAKYFRLNNKISKKYRIILIDKEDFHLFVPSIYEVATTLKNDAGVTRLKNSVSVKYKKILSRVNHLIFYQDTVLGVKIEEKKIILKDKGNIFFEHLVIAVGSEINFYGIEGLQENSYVLKDLKSAVRLRNKIENSFATAKKEKTTLKIVIGGAGVGGVELAGEVTGYLEKLTRSGKNQVKWEVTILEASKTILPTFSRTVIKKAKQRLEKIGVKTLINESISKVTLKNIETTSGKTFFYNTLLWTGGIKPSSLINSLNFKKDNRGQLAVNKNFCAYTTNDKECPEVFAIGDSCCFLASGKPLPATSWSAISQGEHVAKVIISKLKNKKVLVYNPLSRRYVLPIKGKYAIAEIFGVVMAGPHIWFLKELIYLRYLLQILPPWRAIPKWLSAIWLFAKND